jgi:hypothetical protein
LKLADVVVALARTQLDVTEEGKEPNDGVPSVLYAGGRHEPWCAHFCAWVYRSAGRPLPGDIVPTLERRNPIALVQTMEDALRAEGLLFKSPVKGDVVFFRGREGSDKGPGRHCGIVEDVGTTRVQVIEGNVSDRVGRVLYRHVTLHARATAFGRLPET